MTRFLKQCSEMNMVNDLQPQALMDRIAAWLSTEGFKIAAVEIEGFEFALRAGEFTISRPSGLDKLLISLSVDLDEADVERYSGLSSASQTQLTAALAWMLHERSIGFQVSKRGESLRRVAMMQAVYDDGLTKDRLMSEMARLRSTAALVALRIAAAFAAPAQNSKAEHGPRDNVSSVSADERGAKAAKPPGQAFQDKYVWDGQGWRDATSVPRQGELSPDGKLTWDGQKWHPLSAPAPEATG